MADSTTAFKLHPEKAGTVATYTQDKQYTTKTPQAQPQAAQATQEAYPTEHLDLLKFLTTKLVTSMESSLIYGSQVRARPTLGTC